MGSCTNCGSELPKEARICPTCSHPVGSRPGASARAAQDPPAFQVPPSGESAATAQPAYTVSRTEGLAVASLVCGILGIVFSPMGLPIVLSIVAIVFGKQARERIEASHGALDGLQYAKAGFILGIVGVGLGVLVILLIALVFGAVIFGGLSF